MPVFPLDAVGITGLSRGTRGRTTPTMSKTFRILGSQLEVLFVWVIKPLEGGAWQVEVSHWEVDL